MWSILGPWCVRTEYIHLQRWIVNHQQNNWILPKDQIWAIRPVCECGLRQISLVLEPWRGFAAVFRYLFCLWLYSLLQPVKHWITLTCSKSSLLNPQPCLSPPLFIAPDILKSFTQCLFYFFTSVVALMSLTSPQPTVFFLYLVHLHLYPNPQSSYL